MGTDEALPRHRTTDAAEDRLLAVLSYSSLPDARAALAAADERLLSRAVLRRVLLMRPAVRDLLLDRKNYRPETLARLASVLAQIYASGHLSPPSPDFVARLGDRHPSFSPLAREQLMAALPSAEEAGTPALAHTITAAVFCDALDETDLLVLIERGVGRVNDDVLGLIATHPTATPVVWTRLLDAQESIGAARRPQPAAAIASRREARRDPDIRKRLANGPLEARLELALDAERSQFVEVLSQLVDQRPDLAVQLLKRVEPPRSEWIPLESLARLLEAADSSVRQATIAALGRLRIPHSAVRSRRRSRDP